MSAVETMSAGAAISVASSMGSVGPSIGGVSGFGMELGPSIGLGSTIINEGSVATSFIENSAPLQVGGLVGEIKNPIRVEPISQAPVPEFRVEDVIAEVESIMGISNKIMAEVSITAPSYSPFEAMPRMVNMLQPQIRAMVLPVIMSKMEPALKPAVSPQVLADTRKVYAHSILGVERVAIDNDDEGVVNNKVEYAKPDQKKEEEDHKEFILRNVEDERAMRVRKNEFGMAINQAEEEDGQVDGARVVALMPEENEEDRSEVLKDTDPSKELPDGSLVEIKEEFSYKTFSSKHEAKKSIAELIYRKKAAARKRKEGKPIESNDMARVHKYHKWVPETVAIIRMERKGLTSKIL